MSFKIKSEQTLVNVVPVDSVGGAKPEPEERPLETHSVVENIETRAVPVHQYAPKNMTVVVSEVIATATDRLGKQCGNCKNLNATAGRAMMAEIRLAAARGDFDAASYIQRLRMWAIGERAVADPDIFSNNPQAEDPADEYVKQLGLCTAYSALMKDISFMHPAETCPSDEGLQEMADYIERWPGKFAAELALLKPSERLTHSSRPKPLPILFEARDSTIEKLIGQLRDDVMFKANEAKKL